MITEELSHLLPEVLEIRFPYDRSYLYSCLRFDVQVSARPGASVLSQNVCSGVRTSWPISVARSR